MSLIHLQSAAERLLTGEPKDLGFHLDYLKAALETSLSDSFKAEVREDVEQVWRSRARAQQLNKPSSAKYKAMELEFFCGAMAALQALMPDRGDAGLTSFAPPAWVVLPMTGDSIVKP